MRSRITFHNILKVILGSNNVYFQPPSTFKMSYPCIVYTRSGMDIRHADNLPYNHMRQYQVTVIDKNPDSTIPDRVGMLQHASFDRTFKVDLLNHDVFTIFY